MGLSIFPSPATRGTAVNSSDFLTQIPLDEIVMDATLSETLVMRVTWTKHPAGGGATVSDHGIVEPFEFSLTGKISRVGLGGLEIPNPLRLENAVDTLATMVEARQPVFVVDGLFVLVDYFIAGASITRDNEDGGSIIATIDFVKLKIVNSLRIEIPAEIIRASKRAAAEASASAGTQSPSVTTAAAVAGPGTPKSWGASGVDFAAGLF